MQLSVTRSRGISFTSNFTSTLPAFNAFDPLLIPLDYNGFCWTVKRILYNFVSGLVPFQMQCNHW